MHDDEQLIQDGQDPLSAFLTPTPLLDDGDTEDDEDVDVDMFDAGIEDSHRSAPIVRSISPSKLPRRGFRSPPRTPTPPHLRMGSHSPPSLVSTPDYDYYFDNDDDEEEDYVRFPTSRTSLTVPALHNLGSSSSKSRRKTAAVAAAKAQEKEQDRIALMMARGQSYNDNDDGDISAFHVGGPPINAAARGRSFRPMLPARPRSWAGSSTSGRLSPRAWREPSPDVWSIQEEEEDEQGAVSEMDAGRGRRGAGKGKRVRFALNVREEIP